VRASFADFTLCDVKLKDPREKAAASVLDVEADVEGRSGTDGEVETDTGETEDTLCEDPWRGVFCLRNCSALASAFSCVRTNVASCFTKNSPSSESILAVNRNAWDSKEIQRSEFVESQA